MSYYLKSINAISDIWQYVMLWDWQEVFNCSYVINSISQDSNLEEKVFYKKTDNKNLGGKGEVSVLQTFKTRKLTKKGQIHNTS